MYKWNMDTIGTKLIEYETRLNHETNPDMQIKLNRAIASLETLIDYYEELNNPSCIDPGSQPQHLSTREVARSDQKIFKKYGIYYPYFEQMLDNIEKLVIHPKQNLPRIQTDLNQIVTVTSDFYNQFPGEISETFNKIKPTLPTHLQFRRLVGTNVSFAQTISIYGSKTSYYDIGIVNSAQDYITVFHELGHGIANYLNPNFIYYYGKYCFVETDTLFWELLGYDYLTKNLSLANDAYLISLLYLKEYTYDAEIICTKKDLHDHFPISAFRNKKELIAYLKSYLEFDNQYLEDVLYDEIKEIYHYGISYLTAIELYLIYLADPKIAIDLLLRIIKAKNLSSEDYLKFVKSLGIIPGEHIKEYVDLLISRGSELGYGKRLYYQS